MLFVFVSSPVKNFLAKTDFSSLFLHLSRLVFLRCILIFAGFEPHVSYILVSYKKNVHLLGREDLVNMCFKSCSSYRSDLSFVKCLPLSCRRFKWNPIACFLLSRSLEYLPDNVFFWRIPLLHRKAILAGFLQARELHLLINVIMFSHIS